MGSVEENIKLVAKLLNADKSNQKNFFRESRDAFYNELGNKFRPALEESSVPEKAKIFDDLIKIADDLEIFGTFPELIGKTFVGVVGFDRALVKNFITNITNSETANALMLDTNLMAILTDGNKNIAAINDVGNAIDLNLDEYTRVNVSLWRDDVKIPQILRFFRLKEKGKFQNIAVIYFPDYFYSETPFAEAIFKRLDAVAIFISEPPDKIKNPKLLEAFLKWKSLHTIPFISVTSSQNVKLLERDNQLKEIPVLLDTRIFFAFEQLNLMRRNYPFADAVKSKLLEIRYFYEKKIRQLKDDKSQIVHDITLITMNETKKTVKDLEYETRQELNNIEREFEKLRAVSILLLEQAKKYEVALESYLGSKKVFSWCEAAKEIWREIFFKALNIGDFKLATEYMRNLNQVGDAYGYIYEIILQSARGEYVNSDKLLRLRRESDNEFVRRAKMRLIKELRFSEYDYMQIARDINSIETAEENYFRGLWEEHSGDKKIAVNYYKRALKLNFEAAGKKLFELAKSDVKALQILADQMVPEANFSLGERCLSDNRYAAANKYFKLAAVKGYIPAIKFLADDFSQKLLKHRGEQQNLTDTEKNQVMSCIQIYHEVLKGGQDISVNERIGDLYHVLKDERRALEWWQQCETATSYYKRGRLYQYPDGTFPQDLDEAEKFFDKAKSMGHAKAAEEYAKVTKWKANNARKAQEKKTRQKAREEYIVAESSSSGGFCIITSAACAALNKPDDCEELNTLRAYRDEMKSINPIVAALIKEYYRVAPLLVQKINLEADAENIYADLWKNSIAKTYELIRAGKNSQATAIYIDMVQNLCKRYSVELTADTLKNIGLLAGKEQGIRNKVNS